MKAKVIDSKLTYDIRRRILWPHIKDGDYSLMIDCHTDTFHLGTFLNSKIVSIGTFIKENNSKFESNSQYRLRAMATDKNYQSKGCGKILFLKGVEMLKKRKIELLWCDETVSAIPFYDSLNMQSLNSVYSIKNIGPHKTMYLDLNKK